ncbi:polyubiquitin 11-like protein [Carex littledalei]|uniref:Polyubiquitin 11-like protein n=1 Tax=Carex littledalei TaxID=544730 RepID=A0A833QSX5_9POAL|nr:polyubiquitin 11-like protein [Carex littledalei]
MKSEDQSEKDLSRKESDGDERQKMKSEDLTEKDLSRKESDEKFLPSKESDGKPQRMESKDQSKKDQPREESDDFAKITRTIAIDVTNTDKINARRALHQGSAIKLEVQSWYTITELKHIISLDGRLRLFCSVYDQELHDEKTLRQYMINDYAVLKVKTSQMQIFVMFRDEVPVVMNVDAYEKLSDVACRIEQWLELNPEQFIIQVKGRDLDSNSTVCESGIGDDSRLEVVPL